ncbi:helix-turn-helix domain-containing protein [Burkholderia pseudomallei]|uniref:helix-turn-helix transcriptional regulator n=1 Tax=Burkholderia pseudomallei TaxID=28450 RepID=UPI0009B27FF1|nr:helix-turn-helix domain-containing protein [Burkholderia pseudomallei]MBF3538352.1 helix-turn-helix domain-containing protein [Burkholderia pseudomallei]MBF3600666.1 helix-turn-helix domain-containing protein [Burkholderia pseudomallei]
MQQLFSPKTLAAYLGLAEQTIYNRHASGGDLPKAFKLGHLVRFRPTDVEAWMDAKCQSSTVAKPLPGQSTPAGLGRQPTATERIVARSSR